MRSTKRVMRYIVVLGVFAVGSALENTPALPAGKPAQRHHQSDSRVSAGANAENLGAAGSAEALRAATDLIAIMLPEVTERLNQQLTSAVWPTLENSLRLKGFGAVTMLEVRTEVERLLRKVSSDAVKGSTALYAEYFTAQELRDVAAFYRTTTGAKTLQLMPKLIDEQMTDLLPRMQNELASNLRDILKKHGYAATDYNQAIQLDAKYASPYNDRGLINYNNKNYDRAIADFDQAILLDPKYVLAYNNRGNAYRAKGDPNRAIADYDQAIQLDPKYATTYNNRGLVHRAKGDLDRAIADYDQAILLDPKYVLSYNNRGNAFRAKKDYDRAIADYDQAIQLDPKYVLAYNNRGLAHRAKGDLDRAVADYDQAIQLDPKNVNAINGRGYVRFAQANYAAAASDFTLALPLEPKRLYTKLWLYLAQARLGSEAALTNLEMNAKDAKSTEWPSPLLEMFLRRLTPEAALVAARSPGERCEAQFYFAEWLLLRGKDNEAREPLHAAIDACPETFVEFRAAEAELKRIAE
jgi:lipoprotein NlpI